MYATIVRLVLALVTLFAAAPVFAQCELPCVAECRQEASVCNGAAVLESRIGKQLCAAEAAEALFFCDTDALDARADCVGLCGPDLRQCAGDAKSGLKACKAAVKQERALCDNEVAALYAADKVACAEDAADCASTCVE